MNSMLCGVDEAGKGPVLGPMVVAAVACEPDVDLISLGVRDSKVLTPGKRETLLVKIEDNCQINIISIGPDRIDSRGKDVTMNDCVARAHAAAVLPLHPDSLYLDACDVIPERFGKTVKKLLPYDCDVIATHHADSLYPIVSAASIVAKVYRDRFIKELEAEYGEIGSGYPSDPLTIRFLTSYIQLHNEPPPCARKSWKTVSTLLNRNSQKKLFEF